MRKKIFLTLAMVIFGMCRIQPASAQADEIAQLLLNVEKLAQFKQILSDMKKGYEILKGGYTTVKDISEGNFSIHKAFLDGLSAVSPTVRKYYKVAEIINTQTNMVQQYRGAYRRFREDRNFSEQEIQYMGRVYENLFKKSLQNLDELAMILTPGTTRMSDDERLKAIDRIHSDMQDHAVFLNQFNHNISSLGIQRAREQQDVKKLRSLYGINH